MRARELLCALSLLLFTGGCADLSQTTRLASANETMCKHCNCLMPAGVDPDATCPVCSCGRSAHQCVRGR